MWIWGVTQSWQPGCNLIQGNRWNQGTHPTRMLSPLHLHLSVNGCFLSLLFAAPLFLFPSPPTLVVKKQLLLQLLRFQASCGPRWPLQAPTLNSWKRTWMDQHQRLTIDMAKVSFFQDASLQTEGKGQFPEKEMQDTSYVQTAGPPFFY